MDRLNHWNNIYETKRSDQVSWYAPHLERSLELIESTELDPATARIIDVGGGASTLVDDLLDRGFKKITVMDISSAALERTKERLGDRAAGVS